MGFIEFDQKHKNQSNQFFDEKPTHFGADSGGWLRQRLIPLQQ
jgi:hypothetical protein